MLPASGARSLSRRQASTTLVDERGSLSYLQRMMKQSRSLTEGEVLLARSMFGDAIDYGRVRIVRGKWWPFQHRGIVMAPTGNIHFHPDDPRLVEDFSTAPLDLQGLFIHELTHVWQTQKRGRFYLPLMRHPF